MPRTDDDIGFVGGLLPGTETLATALKKLGAEHGQPYKAYYDGKWGIGGTAWTNTPMGMGYDSFRGSWTHSIDTCDAWHALLATPVFVSSQKNESGATLLQALPGYWEQSPEFDDNALCDYFKSQTPLLSPDEIFLACKTRPRQFSKLMDSDMLDHVVDNIQNHDYDTGPLFQLHSTQLMHTPMQYPKEYDDNSPNPDQPDYMKSGETKPPAKNSDLRYTTVNAMRYVDDIFGQVMQAVKDAGQWDNTIVLFTSDNGGAIYTNTANNNYPLRGAKFGPFEGGTRVAQFLTGGWIDKHLPVYHSHLSETFVFPHDWSPTLLEMAAGHKGASKYLLGDYAEFEGPYGSEMWKYIKQSVTSGNKQRKRKSSLAHDFFFDVHQDEVMKLMYFGDTPTLTPRKWSPIFPQDDQYLPDTAYFSIRPCRPEGKALTCCYFDVMKDPGEDKPIHVDCEEKRQEATRLFPIQGGCDEPQSMCLERGSIPRGSPPEDVVLWSHYSAGGPFANANGEPVSDGLSQKCMCRNVQDETTINNTASFFDGVVSPDFCFSPAEGSAKRGAIDCDGTFSFGSPRTGVLQGFAAEGYNLQTWIPVIAADQQLVLAAQLPNVLRTMVSYITREGFSEWPNFSKFPKNAFGYDSCPEKKATAVPIPVTNLNPWTLLAPDLTVPVSFATDLCIFYSPVQGIAYCPSKRNALQRAMLPWNYSATPAPIGSFVDGGVWMGEPYPVCRATCSLDFIGTAYIHDSDEDWGLKQEFVPTTSVPSPPTASPTINYVPTKGGKKHGKKGGKKANGSMRRLRP
mmetsp:Transcript_13040/g.28578  ORF Transcript_13040/g.28578 Transcript_13040/m.28578 type:complete len:795 (-) Transcript_13040:62-2446(-)